MPPHKLRARPFFYSSFCRQIAIMRFHRVIVFFLSSFCVYFPFLNLTTRKGIAIHRFNFTAVSFVCFVCGNSFQKKKSSYKIAVVASFFFSEWRKNKVKISCSDKRLIFVRFLFAFALTQRICDCVGFFTLSYRKMLTCFRWLCVCVFVCFFATTFKKRELFQYKL